jgi:hypothetical protein
LERQLGSSQFEQTNPIVLVFGVAVGGHRDRQLRIADTHDAPNTLAVALERVFAQTLVFFLPK